jgi:hypothetical protein
METNCPHLNDSSYAKSPKFALECRQSWDDSELGSDYAHVRVRTGHTSLERIQVSQKS